MRFTRWDQSVDTLCTNDLIQDLALWHCQESECSQGLEIAELILLCDYEALIHYDIDFSSLLPMQLLHLRQALGFYQKRADIEVGIDKTEVAITKFLGAEALCSQTNDIFRAWSGGRYQFRPFTERVFYRAVKKIQAILGDPPKLSELKLQFGPGATTQTTRKMACAREKLANRPACSEELFPAAKAVLKEMPEYACYHFPELRSELNSSEPGSSGGRSASSCSILPVEIHPGRVVFVPKSAKEHRSVMIEPVLNTMCQAGIGQYMKRALGRSGIDITDQTRNQRLAREGSLTGDLATLDLSSASDTLAKEAVYHFLGGEWFAFLSRFRTGTCTLNGRVMRLEKFSSMGNGFTFPLETLVFFALAHACTRELGLDTRCVSAYGDDIVVPTGAAESLMEVLRDAGFVVNKAKSYWSGPFRESCGKDYLLGTDVRPVYLKDRLTGHDVFRLHNYYVSMFMSYPAARLLDLIDTTIRLWGPSGYGDGHLVSGEWLPTKRTRHSQRGFGGACFDTFTYKSLKSFRRHASDYILASYSVYAGHSYPTTSEVSSKGSPTLVTSSPTAGYDKGELFSTTPGVKGCKRISVYVLSN